MEKKRWVPFINEDFEWLDMMLRAEYNSYLPGVDGDVLRARTIERAMRMNRIDLIDELLKEQPTQ